MFAVLFDVQPKPDQWDAYLGHAKKLRPELERIAGFLDNVRYRSLTREGVLLSVSTWSDEKALVRWRTHGGHHAIQAKGRAEVFADYHLRVGQVTRDTRPPDGATVTEQRLDETEAGAATTVVLVEGASGAADDPQAVAADLGLDADADGLAAWDVYDAVLTPGDAILLTAWRDAAAAEAFATKARLPEDARLRCVRIVRDYGMRDRREAPQYYPAVA